VITALSERIDLGDESVYLRGAASQAMTIDGSGAGAASPGASFRLINDSDHDATFTPGAPQTVLGQASLAILARTAVTLELAPGGNWIKV
jgi:hypothetical protein